MSYPALLELTQAGEVHRQDNAEVTAPFENDAKAAKKRFSASLFGRPASELPAEKLTA
jgi:hypothetical protein